MKLQSLIRRFKNPYFFSALAGFTYLMLGDAGMDIKEAHWDQYVAYVAILVGVYADPTTPGIDKK
jgi:uncharacterized membrane protein